MQSGRQVISIGLHLGNYGYVWSQLYIGSIYSGGILRPKYVTEDLYESNEDGHSYLKQLQLLTLIAFYAAFSTGNMEKDMIGSAVSITDKIERQYNSLCLDRACLDSSPKLNFGDCVSAPDILIMTCKRVKQSPWQHANVFSFHLLWAQISLQFLYIPKWGLCKVLKPSQ